ncbi:SDR family NAD(P)-dependent oxidoreductase [Flavobacterium psychrotrophum]|uniref:SDR family NAD(P)-dependent oxidoreductase n=1 Tax=Flavobacterium psychrotrophum TaxID=2294119 RepID=UPI000E31679E|nr:SDR family NAD(P)-dependent oxidoreductase [Flavobacterium psychrotrophum]
MKKSLLIIGAGEGLSLATAEKFGKEGFAVGLINRDKNKAAVILKTLAEQHIDAYSEVADATDYISLEHAIRELTRQLGGISVLIYNPAALKNKDILDVEPQEFMDDFKINVGSALKSIQLTIADLKVSSGTILLTGGGFATHPSFKNGTLSIGKAGIRNLALQLNEKLGQEGIYVGTLTITAKITPDSTNHNPVKLAQAYWEMFNDRIEVEVII